MLTRRAQLIGLLMALSVIGCGVIGCGETAVPGGGRNVSYVDSFIPRIDATSDETCWLSLQKMEASLPQERQAQLRADIPIVTREASEKAAAETAQAVGDIRLHISFKPIHGLTATEIHERAEASRRR